ncbi:hypothetical protein Poly41_68020 [Novipirellula artificiosorum]|uniref:Uncharacterized protein n=1 Tax=Novipirellula artificiosorum TaxID=2528016 RepID=A0A5C6D217_9BACT|nr:hypothetical protein Poly41_68020 [Novipirellula artificiosorum]
MSNAAQDESSLQYHLLKLTIAGVYYAEGVLSH